MNERNIYSRLAESQAVGIGDLEEEVADPFTVVSAEALVPVMTFLRDDSQISMDMLHLVTAVEKEDSIEVVYHLCSTRRHHSFVVKVVCLRPEGGGHDNWTPEVPSVAGVFNSADWHEREQWDLLGVHFTGHPDLRRLLLPEEWVGHPLRKDYAYPSEHGGIPLELDATPIYERGPDWVPPEKELRPAGTPLKQPPAEQSNRPHAGGQVLHVQEAPAAEEDDGDGGEEG